MSKAKYSTEVKDVLDALLLQRKGIEDSKVFGLPCYKLNGKIFATIYEQEVGIKLPPERAAALLAGGGTKPFQPFGKNRGKQYVALVHDNAEGFMGDEELLLESAYYAAGVKQG